MEENEFKSFYKELNPTPCVYQKAILSARCACPHSNKLNIAEREAVACLSSEGRVYCQHVFDTFIAKAKFALHKIDDAPLTHAEMIKVQVGGIEGLKIILHDSGLEASGGLPQIGDLTKAAFLAFPGLKKLPIETIIRSVVHCKVRNRKQIQKEDAVD